MLIYTLLIMYLPSCLYKWTILVDNPVLSKIYVIAFL